MNLFLLIMLLFSNSAASAPGYILAIPSKRSAKAASFVQPQQFACCLLAEGPFSRAVVEELFSAVGPAGAGLAEGLLQRLGELCAAAAEAAEEDAEEDGDGEGNGDGDVVGRAAKAALGAAIRSLGPAAVLRVLPLNLQNVSSCPAACNLVRNLVRILVHNLVLVSDAMPVHFTQVLHALTSQCFCKELCQDLPLPNSSMKALLQARLQLSMLTSPSFCIL